jgi:hypothetical protein
MTDYIIMEGSLPPDDPRLDQCVDWEDMVCTLCVAVAALGTETTPACWNCLPRMMWYRLLTREV